MAHTRAYRDGNLVAEGFPVAEVSDHLTDPDTVVWFDLCEPNREEMASIAEELNLHSLAVEDALNRNQRPKLDRYQSHLFVTAYTVALDTGTGEMAAYEVDVFLTSRALVTVRASHDFDIDEVMRRWDGSPDLAKYGVAFLLHGLLDYVVDSHFSAVQQLDEQIEALEDMVFAETNADVKVQRRTYELRKSLVGLRRYVLPMREVINSLLRRDLKAIDASMEPYYQDVYDHVLRATEQTESLRDLVTNLLDTTLNVRSNRLNVITKQVTSWAAIIAVPTAITGFYGQNVPYPGYGKFWGFVVSTVFIALISGGLYAIFRRKDWL
jgi:magnesium transporter